MDLITIVLISVLSFTAGSLAYHTYTLKELLKGQDKEELKQIKLIWKYFYS